MRSRLHDDIQSLHGTMPLWGLDRWVSLGDLFVDVNILGLISRNRRSELNELWEDFSEFSQNDSDYHSLDRIGLSISQQRVRGLAVLKHNNNLMVVGKPGSGKSTYLQKIITECNDGKLQAQRIPTLIRLREFIDDGKKCAYNLEQFLKQLWKLDARDIELVLKQGLALILLDGLDEIAGEVGKKINKEIRRFARTYPQIQLIVTCRTQSQESQFDRFDYVEVADFNDKQVRAFAKHWFVTVCTDEVEGDTKAQEFLLQLFQEENKAIRELAITPILLSLTCAVFHQTGKFYSKRSKLYQEGLDLLLEQWDKSREIERDEIYRDLSVEKKLKLLSYVAMKKFEQQQYVLFEQKELEIYISEFLEIERRESRDVLLAIEAQHGLLIERAQKIWSFSHLTFQEYLVAQSLKYQLSSEEQYQSSIIHIFKAYWKEVYLLLVEVVSEPQQLLRTMKDEIDIFLLDRDLDLVLNWIEQKATLSNKGNMVAIRFFYLSHILGLDYEKFIYSIDSSNETRKEIKRIRNIDSIVNQIYSLLNSIRKANGSDNFNRLRELTTKLLKILDRLEKKSHNSLAIKELIERMPDSSNNNSKLFYKWCIVNFKQWLKELDTILNQCSLSNDLNLGDSEITKLEGYYHANSLLLNCLNNLSDESQEFREDIKSNLLLPIAEIEKRKQSNY